MNRVKQQWKAGKVAVNVFTTIPNAFSAEVLAQGGWDSVTVDMQHGVHDYASMLASFQAMQPHPVTAMARVPWNEPGVIGRALDAGAYGIICPMVNTKADAEAFADWVWNYGVIDEVVPLELRPPRGAAPAADAGAAATAERVNVTVEHLIDLYG